MPDVGSGGGAEVVDIVKAEVVMHGIELVAVKVEVVEVKEELLSVEAEVVETERVAVLLEEVIGGCGGGGLMSRLAFHNYFYMPQDSGQIIIESSNGKQVDATYLVFAGAFS
jgi:hypothetical protein